MLRSMTGFGRSLSENGHIAQQWEIKSVNSRHLDLKWRLPTSVRALEPHLERCVRRHASRGRLEISLLLQYAPGDIPALKFNEALAAAMLESLRALAAARGETFAPDYAALLHVPALWGDSGADTSDEQAAALEEGLVLALEDWNEARATEGQALATDLHSRILRMEEWTSLIAERAPDIREERIQALRDRLSEVLAREGEDLEESRFLQEVVILTDRLDVTEELTRLTTHLARLRELLQTGRDAGRRLDFTLQECFREITTCGNKLPDVQLSRLVVDFKNELEKCREQVQNLE